MADNDDDDYPLNCIDETGDGFSGWFAISNPRQCNDFCYWHLTSSSSSSSDSNNSSSSTSYYAAWNTADPHQSTVIHTPIGTAYWTCIYDSADDKTTVSKANGESWVESWEKYSSHRGGDGVKPHEAAEGVVIKNVPFPYLRCQKGAGERLKTLSGEVVRSAMFWESWIVLASLIYVGEFVALFFLYKRGKLRYEQVDLGSSHEVEGSNDDNDEGQTYEQVVLGSLHEDGVDEQQTASLQIDEVEDDSGEVHYGVVQEIEATSYLSRFTLNQQKIYFNSDHMSPRCRYCAPLTSLLCKDPQSMQQRSFYILRILLIVILNLLLAFTISFSAISLMEINVNPHFKEGMQKLTPACSDPTLVCPAGNKDINRQSTQWPPPEIVHGKNDATQSSNDATTKSDEKSASETSDHAMQSFSYIIASDAQLYWFNGEFAEMGNQSLPSSCSPSDSCGRCTGKHGLSTNKRLQKAWENLMLGKTDGLNDGDGDLPIPNTLIMNGDLTAYFHPYEKHAYDSIYSNIDGLKYYFPSLGNHDIEHHYGAMYGGDEWVGLPNCNVEHALGYFRSGFCGKIPAFDTDRIVRYDSSSLAYSWDEGRYHFVHSHYYPTYEMASMDFHSSVEWLERDLQMAHDTGLTTILFVHAAQGLNPAMEEILLGKNVRAIIAGHTHRCLHRRCEGIHPLNEDQVKDLDSLDIAPEKCIPAAYDTCQVLNGENLVYLKDMKTIPAKQLHYDDRKDKPLCPKPAPYYINETDNTLLCHQVIYSQPNYPFESDNNSTETIPVFWSGSSSFETFLRGDFFDDRIVINALKVSSDEGEVARYVDLHTVPNAVYPYHEVTDMEETRIWIHNVPRRDTSKWADVYLQQLKEFSPSYLKDSYQLLGDLNNMGELPEGTVMFTMDATAMYTNIDTQHGLEILKRYIEMFKEQLPENYPTKLILMAMYIIMNNNIFEFGPATLEQLCGTAMGTPSACMYATVYYAFHEITVLLHKYSEYLIFYKRLIDDGFGLWNDRGNPEAWTNFCNDVNNFVGGKLKWEIEERSREVNFLDITITINELNQIETRTYQKPMNLYLYIPQASAHPKGVIKGMIF
ncbi:hypothetical protein ACHAXR_010762, partial [Thalassiosira sp. AJA248-18]